MAPADAQLASKPLPPYLRVMVLPHSLALVAAAAATHALPAAAQQRVVFDIPAQSLDSALDQYFRITAVPLLYASGLTSGRRSAPVKGVFTPREALRRLLGGTGLVARYTRSDAVVVAPADSPEIRDTAALIPLGRVVVRERAPTPAPPPLDRRVYYDLLEQALQARLEADKRTARRDFSAVIGIRIGEDARVAQVRIERSSGDGTTDRLLRLVLTGAAIPHPPAGLTQPLRVAVTGRR